MMLAASLEIARCWKDFLTVCKPLVAGVCGGDELLCFGAGAEGFPAAEVGESALLTVSIEV